MNWLKSHWPAVMSAAGFAIPFLLPSINAYVAAHPHTVLGVVLSCVVAAFYANSPKQQAQTKENK